MASNSGIDSGTYIDRQAHNRLIRAIRLHEGYEDNGKKEILKSVDGAAFD
jgi:hypothetical protein